jgi:hypothetical protein
MTPSALRGLATELVDVRLDLRYATQAFALAAHSGQSSRPFAEMYWTILK